jgi:hypothetical protein
MLRPFAAVTVALAVIAHVAAAADIDQKRVKSSVARFLGLPESEIQWPKAILAPSGAPRWLNPIGLRLPDPPTAPMTDNAKTISIQVHWRDYYVQAASWEAHWPPDAPKCRDPLSLEACQAVAESFARQKLVPWPRGMKLASRAFGPVGLANPICQLRWEECYGPARTGTTVTIQVNPCPPGEVYGYGAYIAPPHSVSEVKITREQAIAIAVETFRKKGAQNPRVFEEHAELYLSEPWL